MVTLANQSGWVTREWFSRYGARVVLGETHSARRCACSYCRAPWRLLNRPALRAWNAWTYIAVRVPFVGRVYLRWTGTK